MNTNTVAPNAGTIDTLRELAASRTPWIDPAAVELFASTNSAEVVAQRIDWLEKQPVARRANSVPPRRNVEPVETNPAAEVPEGRYAVTGPDGATKFYRIDRPTEGRWAGYVFVKVQAGDDLHNVRNRGDRQRIFRQILADGIETAMLRYGKELGHCGHCGRTLTNPESLERGIGPVCASKMGF